MTACVTSSVGTKKRQRGWETKRQGQGAESHDFFQWEQSTPVENALFGDSHYSSSYYHYYIFMLYIVIILWFCSCLIMCTYTVYIYFCRKQSMPFPLGIWGQSWEKKFIHQKYHSTLKQRCKRVPSGSKPIIDAYLRTGQSSVISRRSPSTHLLPTSSRGYQQQRQLENTRSIQIFSNNADQGHALSGHDWQVTAAVSTEGRGHGGLEGVGVPMR